MRALGLVVLLALVWVGGLVAFGQRVGRLTPAAEPPGAEALVALTGGSNLRLAAAAELLEAGKARRLLISGVDPRTTRREVRDVARDFGRGWDCCVDLGFRAQTTRGNASETAVWARRHRYRSLIVVTADYHMPRALLELRAAMPGVVLFAYPVATETLDAKRWWQTQTSARRLAVEYTKYLVICVREAARGLAPHDATPTNVEAPA